MTMKTRLMGDAALLMKVHTSNYEIKGPPNEVSLSDLSQLADGSEIPSFRFRQRQFDPLSRWVS